MGRLGQVCEKKGIHQFLYKNLVKVMNLQMVDDILDIQLCGFNSVASNTFINTQIEMKRLTLHTDKCKQIHVGQEYEFCPSLKAHDKDVKLVTQDKYLGDIISSTIYGEEGSNNKNIKQRKSSGMGISSQIMSILQSVSLGYFYFEIAKLLRESMLVNGTLFNSEVWYGLTQYNIAELEDVDKVLLRRVLGTPISTPIESLYLEMGCIPFRFVIMGRRLMFFHYLANLEDEEMLSKFFVAQWEHPVSNDWTETVKKDMEFLNIKCDRNNIKLIKKEQFKKVVKKSIQSAAFDYLIDLKESHSKMTNIQYSELKQQEYLKSSQVPAHKAKSLFKFRTRMNRVRSNFKQSHADLSCPVCLVAEDRDDHLLECIKIKENCIQISQNITAKYMDIFSSSIEKMVAAVDLLDAAMKVRETILD